MKTYHVLVEAGSPWPLRGADADGVDAARQILRPVDGQDVIPYGAWAARRAASYTDRPQREITAERFREMMDILPPIGCRVPGASEAFLMPEMIFDGVYAQFARFGDRHFTKDVAPLDGTTFIVAPAPAAAR